MSKFTYKVKAEDGKLALKDIIKREFSFSSRLMTKLKQNKAIFINGVSMPGWVSVFEGDVIDVILPKEKSDFTPEDIPINVVYEDEYLLLINKEAGYPVHPTKGKPCHTIANGISKKMADEGEVYKIRFVNRLDMNTSGVLIVAKNAFVQNSLVKQMAEDLVTKKYKALVEGIIENDEGTIDKPIGRPDEKEVERWILPVEKGGYESITHYKVLERYIKPHEVDWGKDKKQVEGYSLVELKLDTGRTHQIRVHLADMGYPIVGDHLYCHGDPFLFRSKYGDPRPSLTGEKKSRGETNPEIVSKIINRQALHSYYLEFMHPILNKKVIVSTELPKDIQEAVDMIIKDL